MKSLQSTALQIVTEIFSNGRIEDFENWFEMRLELEYEMNERKIEGDDRQAIIDTVKGKWY